LGCFKTEREAAKAVNSGCIKFNKQIKNPELLNEETETINWPLILKQVPIFLHRFFPHESSVLWSLFYPVFDYSFVNFCPNFNSVDVFLYEICQTVFCKKKIFFEKFVFYIEEVREKTKQS
jgi:hypothetical protein